ncbi:hypothetical protein ACU8NH_30205 (plasmid) [Rhizobium leguminosarum]|uniref:membrane protein n=1 Tax=Rhizobium leguminosarum TaxID=384 RepID=UPI000647B593|nr:membrane protein [Rhizobium leguminosarum]TBZ53404.1 hypothetical protein E0H44_00435 [Rhizobium leguminosarum bv. viciae]TCA16903.1 hypothetical protein E0H68_07980 [Rhizobium leguminosarum bv. viciae]TCA24904.1 hypothetical protein E0H67_09555 [Rhizobium leguminosarum bv. viciae]
MGSAKVNTFRSFEPTADEICLQVERILMSEEFHTPKRGRNFLEFVVNETLAGRSGFLKAFTIANMVFGREASFDPQNDPVVRIEAGRIRKALERYYLVAGQADEVIITVPKGGYVPHFEYAQDALDPVSEPVSEKALEKSPAGGLDDQDDPLPDIGRRARPVALGLGATLVTVLALLLLALAGALSVSRNVSTRAPPPGSAEPKVVVDFFAESGLIGAGSDIARGLRDDVIGQLAQFDDIVVVTGSIRGEAADGAAYALQGNVQLDGSRMRAAARLVRQSDGAVIWADNYDANLDVQNKLVIQADVARKIASAIAQPYGAIFQADTETIARPAENGGSDAYACTLIYYSYRQTMTEQSHRKARECLQQTTQRFPDNASSWALLSMVYLDEIRFRYKLGTPASAQPLELAIAAVERAISLAPGNPHVLQAQMLVSFFRGDIGKALTAGTSAYAANPDDVEVAGEYGSRLAMSGKWQSGCELLSIALSRNAGPKGFYEVGMALCAFMRGDIEAAEQWSRRSDLDGNPMHHLLLLSILGTAGKTNEARLEREWLNTHAPEMMGNVRAEVSLRLQRPEDQELFLNGLRAAGMDIPPVNTPR